MISVTVTKKGSLRDQLLKRQSDLAGRVAAGIKAVGHHLLYESQKLVPLDTEALADSGQVTFVSSGYTMVVTVGYGSVDFPSREVYSKKEDAWVLREPYKYAVYVHENEKAHHDTGQANFLRQPALDLETMRAIFRSVII